MGTVSVDRVFVDLGFGEVKSASSEAFFGEHSCLAGVLEGSAYRVFDFIDVLSLFDAVYEHIGAYIFRSEAPYFQGVSLVPRELFM